MSLMNQRVQGEKPYTKVTLVLDMRCVKRQPKRKAKRENRQQKTKPCMLNCGMFNRLHNLQTKQANTKLLLLCATGVKKDLLLRGEK